MSKATKVVWPNKNTPTQELFDCIRTDMGLLRSGDWAPDDDSIDATLGVLAEIEKRCEERRRKK